MPRHKTYRVVLSDEERTQLIGLINKGKAAARKLVHARILLAADENGPQPSRTDGEVAQRVQSSTATVHRVRKALIEEGLEQALTHKRPSRTRSKVLDGAGEAHLVAFACSEPPEGRVEWTMQLLADRLVELRIVESISAETVRKTLKKTKSNRG